jgi:hypothetical protein
MRLLFFTFVLGSAAVQLVASQERIPRGELFRGPLVSTRPATLVEERGLPLDFAAATMDLGAVAPWARLSRARLHTRIRSKIVRTVPVAGITLRVGVGPAPDGMYTFRMRGRVHILAPESFKRIAPGGEVPLVTFVAASEDVVPGVLLINLKAKVAFTVERVEGDEGQLIFENPDTTELLWEALGRPTLSPE